MADYGRETSADEPVESGGLEETAPTGESSDDPVESGALGDEDEADTGGE